MDARSRERLAAILAPLMLLWSAWPPHAPISPVVALPLAVAALLLDAAFPPARLNRAGSGAPALLLALGLAGAPWMAGVVVLARGCLAVLLGTRQVATIASGAVVPLLAVLLTSRLPAPAGWMIWPLSYLSLSALLLSELDARGRLRAALGETAWATSVIAATTLGPWPELGVLLGLLVYHALQSSAAPGSSPLNDALLADRFSRQMDRVEDTLRSTERRHEKQKEKYHDFVTLQAMLDDFQGQALRATSPQALVQALLSSVCGLEAWGNGAVLEGGEVLAATPEFFLENFGSLPRSAGQGKILRSPDGLRVVFPLSRSLIFVWQRPRAAEDLLRDELLRHLLERAGLIVRILEQQNELAESLEQRTQALEELARSQAQLVQSGKMAAVGQMAAGVAHELNSPLAAIALQLQMARRRLGKSDTDGVARSLDTCESASSRAKAIIENLLTFSRLSDGSQGELSLADLVEHSMAMLDGHFEQAGVTCEFSGLSGLPPVRGNAQDIQHVLTNIAVNAVDALKARESDRRLKVKGQLSDGRVRLEIFNNGPTIDPAHLDKLFEPFFTTKEAGQGTGLGLSLSYQLMEAHDGTLTVENRPHGVAFTLTFPALL